MDGYPLPHFGSVLEYKDTEEVLHMRYTYMGTTVTLERPLEHHISRKERLEELRHEWALQHAANQQQSSVDLLFSTQ